MSEQLYSIKESTLTDIGDALRRKHGETRIETVTVDGEPVVVVSKTPNATGFDSWDGDFDNTVGVVLDVVQIPNASTIKVKIKYDFPDWNNYISIASGSASNYSDFLKLKNIKQMAGITLTPDTITFDDTDTITFCLMTSSSSTTGSYLGYYAEVYGLENLPNTYGSDEMAQAIDDICEVPNDALVISGNCSYRFYAGAYDWIIKLYGNKIKTENITSVDNMFKECEVTEIPFDINVKTYNDAAAATNSMFYGCEELVSAPYVKGIVLQNATQMFSYCRRLTTIPDDWADYINWSYIHDSTSVNLTNMFAYCHSLRKIPENLLSQLWSLATGYYYVFYSNAFNQCHVLDEVKNVPVHKGAITQNAFGSVHSFCCRLKDFIFAMNEDGTPQTANWKSQTINFTNTIGYTGNDSTLITKYNSGLTTDTLVTDDASYQALKDNPDWWANDKAYSRYNHDSAVNTINSLPDTSAYLAEKGGTNTITFTGEAGSKTDGGAINTLTAEEIAVATAKGWTVTLV